MNENKKSLIINILCTLLYAVFTIVIVMHHEIWADEAQVWLLVKNLSIPELFKHLVNEGHPSFFYLLVMPFAKLFNGSFGILAMQIICWLSMVISVFLLLQFSPFNKYAKFGIVTSAGFLYFLPVIARSYSILPVLIFLAAILYQKQKERPILYALVLAMIANTHVIMFAFVFLLGLEFIYEYFIKAKLFCKKYICSALIIFSGLFAVVLQLFGTSSSNGAIELSVSDLSRVVVRVLVQFFANTIDYGYSILLSQKVMPEHVMLYFIITVIFAVLFIVLLLLPFWLNKKIASITFLSISFQFAIYIFAYSALIYPNRTFVAFLILIWGYWQIMEQNNRQNTNKFLNKKIINAILSVFFLLTAFNGIDFSLKDIKNNYSSAKDTAQFIEKNIEKDALLIPTGDAFALGLCYYLPEYNFRSIYSHTQIKYMIWKKNDLSSDLNADIFFTKLMTKDLNENNIKHKKIYVIASDFLNLNHFEETMPESYKLLYVSRPSYAVGEAFKIYEYKKLNN